MDTNESRTWKAWMQCPKCKHGVTLKVVVTIEINSDGNRRITDATDCMVCNFHSSVASDFNILWFMNTDSE